MEQKPKEVLFIDPPSELHFSGPFTRPVVTVMTLTNPTEYTVLFKIKTTAPKRYCVRPNFGVVKPHSITKVDIILQPFVYDANEKNKHKFMVQSLIAPDDSDDLNRIWKEAEPDNLMDAKLKCVFDAPPAAAPVGSESSQSGTGKFDDYLKDMKPKVEEEKISNLPSLEQAEALVSELRLLREENSTLRKDNINLKEQVMRLRVSPAKPPMDEPYRPMAVADKQIPMFYIATSILVAIFCLLLGKYLL